MPEVSARRVRAADAVEDLRESVIPILQEAHRASDVRSQMILSGLMHAAQRAKRDLLSSKALTEWKPSAS